jgi:quinol-cytochrome oxidoreductase complex cytochrome b subunit
MEVHELKEWMDERFDRCETMIAKLETKVDAHEGWITSVKAIWWVVSGLCALMIAKWEVWNRWFGGK